MSGQPTPDSRRVNGDTRARRTAGLVVVLVVVFIGVAIAKPWGSPVVPVAPTPGPLASVPSTAPSSPGPSDTTAPTTAAAPTPVLPLPGAFTTTVPPTPTATWTGLRWRRLASDDPLSLVRSVLRWRGGFIAVGWLASGGSTSTPVWTSRDGAHWEPPPVNTSGTFWPGMFVVGVAGVPTGLVALTEFSTANRCGGPPACQEYTPPFIAWTSPDGRSWAPVPLADPRTGNPNSRAPVLAAGPAGLIAASTGTAPHAALSADGVHWRALPDATFPTRFALADLLGTPAGYLAVGEMMSSTTQGDAATLWSTDGRTWTSTPSLPVAAESGIVLVGTPLPTAVRSVIAGRDGFVATGDWIATPGGAIWWQSPDGQHWRLLDAYPPLGPTTCVGAGCGLQPNGALVGDGTRIVALRGGPDAGAWLSADGLAWRRLPVSGQLPTEEARQAVILPGGVLL
ncbi:MAG: hypothetical protein ACHQNA_11625, partial [Acidimicrobiales bacterium]